MSRPSAIAKDVVVTIAYTLKNDDGDVLDSSEGGEPLEYLHGHGNIVPGLEKALLGRKVGEALKVEVAPAEGYGERDPNGLRALERSAFPPDAELEPGVAFMAEMEDEEVVQMWVIEVDDEYIHVDLNHPLAGATLHFDVKILDLRLAHPSEIAHGHPHGPDGHHHH